jgi:hypothetical protein
MNEELLGALCQLMEVHFWGLTKPIRKNLVALSFAFLLVLSAVRSGQGRLSLGVLARALPTEGTAHAREKRLDRFLKNARFDFRTVTGSLARLLLPGGRRFCPVLLDQTQSGSAQALLAAVPYAGRALPLGCYTFAYPLAEPALKSQNQLEHIFLLDTEASFPVGLIPVWIGDRAYARSVLLQQNEQERRPYILRGRRETLITYKDRRMKLGQIPAPPGKLLRYENVLYHSQRKVPVDVVVYYDGSYQEPWYLLTPVAYRKLLTTDLVLDLYAERMQIEQSFRDFKTHLGLRGLNLQIEIAPRMGRLLLAFCLAYILCILLGESPLGEEARRYFEILRQTPRHGTRRTLSALPMAMLILSHPAWVKKAIAVLLNIIWKATARHALLTPTQIYLPHALGP